jgi:predicted nucleic acid-binding protein
MQQYGRTGLLIDTNLLLLYLVGLLDRTRITRFERTEKYTPEDFDALVAIVGRFQRVVTTPHILAETSNLGGQLGGKLHAAFFDVLATAITTLDEQYVRSNDAMQGYRKLGLTDAGIIHIARTYLILTDDFPLSGYLQSIGADVINFNWVRSYLWK